MATAAEAEDRRREGLGILLALFPPKAGDDEDTLTVVINAHMAAARKCHPELYYQACCELLEVWPYRDLPNPHDILTRAKAVRTRLKQALQRRAEAEERQRQIDTAMDEATATRLLAELPEVDESTHPAIAMATSWSRVALRACIRRHQVERKRISA